MRKNLAETCEPEDMIERDAGSEKQGISMDRRVNVAPMMDWSDSRNFRQLLNYLRAHEIACRSFVAAPIFRTPN
jgi:tRNA-dihydrouridine synthase